MMKRASAAIAAVAALAVSTSAWATPVCIQSHLIQNTTTPDSHTILFHMDDGTVWRNDLKGSCPSLKFYGFEYTEHSIDEVCSNMQSIRVIQSHEVCMLGDFTKEAPAHSHM